jgi:hypothetical protein
MKLIPASTAFLTIAIFFDVSYAQVAVKLGPAAPDFRATAVERREERAAVDCDKKADEAKVPRKDRFTFFEKCLAGEPQALK